MNDSNNTWIHRIARVTLVKPLAATSVTPNQITTARLVTGLASAAAIGTGLSLWQNIGAAAFIISMLLDRVDGGLARLTGGGSLGIRSRGSGGSRTRSHGVGREHTRPWCSRVSKLRRLRPRRRPGADSHRHMGRPDGDPAGDGRHLRAAVRDILSLVVAAQASRG
ncbi:MAG: CDP-alcohol phosphatidyltransferase family protein [Rhodospirillales bacterium]|nr:CDP-alcohol phosphatidyltransferase family protein [Rhodospirillales bacterium]